MKKKYPRINKIKKFEGYFVAHQDLITHSTIAVDRQIFPLIISLLNSAVKNICLAYFQFSLDEKSMVGIPFHLYSSLKSRKSEGVDIKVLLNQKFANVFQYALNRRCGNLLEKGDIPTRFTNAKSTLHSKLIIVDYDTALISSANLTTTSLADNHEIAVMIKSCLVKDILFKWFCNLWEVSY